MLLKIHKIMNRVNKNNVNRNSLESLQIAAFMANWVAYVWCMWIWFLYFVHFKRAEIKEFLERSYTEPIDVWIQYKQKQTFVEFPRISQALSWRADFRQNMCYWNIDWGCWRRSKLFLGLRRLCYGYRSWCVAQIWWLF